MAEPLRLAIIGCGWAGARHAQALFGVGAELRWAIDVDQGRAAAVVGQHPGARAATDHVAALADAAVEAVDICLPHALHAPVAVAAARAGKHILVEKPLAGTLDEADQMIAAADQAGVVLMVAEQVRFSPLFQTIRDLLDDGAIGHPALIQMTREAYLTRSFLEDRPWFLDQQAAAGGIMMSGGIHDFETMRMLIGEVTSVQALRAPQRFREMQGDDTSVALVRFANGVVGTLVESFIMKSLTTAGGPEVHTLRIDGALGNLSVRDGQTITLYSERPDLVLRGRPTQHELLVLPVDTFALEIAHFVQAVRSGQEPVTSGRSQRRALECVLAAYQSMASGGQPVTLAPAPPRSAVPGPGAPPSRPRHGR